MGDFIVQGNLIFPIDDFMIYADDVWIANEPYRYYVGGVNTAIWDLSQYNVLSPNFNPFAGVTSEVRKIADSDEDGNENSSSPSRSIENNEAPTENGDSLEEDEGNNLIPWLVAGIVLVVLVLLSTVWYFWKRKNR